MFIDTFLLLLMLNTNDKTPSEIYKKVPIHQTEGIKIRLFGFYLNYLKNASDNWITQMEYKNPRMMELLREPERSSEKQIVPWEGEYAGKLLLGAVQVSRLIDDENLKSYINGLISRLQSIQSEDGYIGIWPKKYRMTGYGITADGETGTSDAWAHYYLILGLLMWYEDTGDKRSFDMAVKIGDLMYKSYKDKPDLLSKTGDFRWNSSISHGLTYLYKITGDKKYFELAREIVDIVIPMHGFDYINRAINGESFHENPVPYGERWEAFPGITSYADMYWMSGNQKYSAALKKIWEDITSGDIHNNGGATSMEHCVNNPYDRRAIELCCTIAYIAMSVEMLKLTSDSKIADQIEQSTFNAALSFWARNGKWMTYNTVMEGKIVPCAPWDPNCHENPGLYCCTAYSARGLGILSEWAVMRNNDDVVINWYGKSKSEIVIGNKKAIIEQETDYPRTGKIKIKIVLQENMKFKVNFRIPEWSKKTGMYINGKPYKTHPGKYVSIDRIWENGDTIIMNFDMSLRYVSGSNECKDRISLYRGPVLLALKRKSIKETAKFIGDWKPIINMRETEYYDLMASDKIGDKVLYGFIGSRIAIKYNKFKNSGMMDIKIDGKHIDTIDQYGESDDNDMFAYENGITGLFLSDEYEINNLSEGSHTLELIVSEEKNVKSIGNRITVREILTDDTDPVFDTSNLISRLLPQQDPTGADVRIKVSTADNKKVTLIDYDSASKNEEVFATWFKISTCVKKQIKSKEN